MPTQHLHRLAPWLAAATLSLLALSTRAADSPATAFSAQGDFDEVSFSSTIDQVGFSFTLGTGYSYDLVLDLNGVFREQTGLIGYVSSIKLNGEGASWANLSATNALTETYKLGLTGVGPGTYWLELSQLNPGKSGGAAINLTALQSPTPPIPEPETYAMMLAGLGTIAWMTRRKRHAA